MNNKGQIPTLMMFLGALVLVITALTAMATFTNDLEFKSDEVSTLMHDIDFNKKYTIAQATLLGNRASNKCPYCSAELLKGSYQAAALETETLFKYRGAGNFYGKIRSGDFKIVEKDNFYEMTVNDLFAESNSGDNQIRRFYNLELTIPKIQQEDLFAI